MRTAYPPPLPPPLLPPHTCPDGPARPMLRKALGDGEVEPEKVDRRGDSRVSSYLAGRRVGHVMQRGA